MQGVNIEKVVWLLLTMFNSSDANDYGNPIVAISGGYPIQYTENGKTCNEMPWNGVELNTDLVIVTDDSELTEFEKVLI